jgi:hypothetical protein
MLHLCQTEELSDIESHFLFNLTGPKNGPFTNCASDSIDFPKIGLIASLGLTSTMMTIAAFSSVAVVRHSCAKLSVPMDGAKAVAVAVGTVFVKTTWLPSRFSLAMTDGADAEVRLRGE